MLLLIYHSVYLFLKSIYFNQFFNIFVIHYIIHPLDICLFKIYIACWNKFSKIHKFAELKNSVNYIIKQLEIFSHVISKKLN